MTPRKIIGLILFFSFAAMALSGCGHGGGDSNTGATITLTPTKAVALADGTDVATVRADVENADGTPAADGTSVAFSASDSTGPLSSATAATVNGKVSFSLTHAPITGATNRAVTITASAGGASASQDVKFITQPTSVDVFINFKQAVTNLAGLQFTLINLNSTASATFDNIAQLIFPMNNAVAGSQSLVAGKFDPATNSTKIGFAFAGLSGFDTGTAPIIKATFAVSSGLPVFSVDELSSAATFTATGPDFGATTPPVTAENLVVTVSFDTER